MEARQQMFLSQQELAARWSRSESAIGLATAVGVGPRYVQVDGQIKYPVDEIRQYERACLFFDPAEVAFRAVSSL